MLIDSSAIVIAIATLIPGAILAMVGWLVLRVVKGIDEGVAALGKKVDSSVGALSAKVDDGMRAIGAKVDSLGAQDTQILIQLEGLRTRVNTLELLVHRQTEPRAAP